METGMQVADAMTMNVISVTPDFSLPDTARLMTSNKIGAVAIKDKGKFLGLLTERDIVRKAVAKNINIKRAKVKDFMRTELATIGPAADLYEALIEMRDNSIRHLPVVENNKLIGLLTIKDVLKIEPQLFDLIVEKYELKEESRKLLNTLRPEEGICNECGEYSEKIKNDDEVSLCENCSKPQTTVV
ncbi:CBS domain-containing protein [Candidatus Woesearchaeota archaeon]|nr:CBS domain-containing protein [Candidatus Woesearchaeota archaeon]